MNSKLNIILCASGHLPSGTGEAVFEELYINEIKPLVSALDKFPRINIVFHYSGVLLYWIERRYPELFMLLGELLSRKQAEFLGGGFYNPILSLLPTVDRIGQIEMLTTYLRKHFGKRPQGCWLPPMAWEQSLVGPLSSCGFNYTFLDDQEFHHAGIYPGQGGIFSPCITEDQGKLITVFPVAGQLGRELIKSEPPESWACDSNFMSFLGVESSAVESDSPLIVLPIGGESTIPSSSFYENLFSKFYELDSSIEFTSPSRLYRNLKGLKKVYFPSLQICRKEESKVNPRRFMAEYPEASGIYAKTVYVHSLINTQLRGDKARKRTALEELWKAQDSGLFRLGCAVSPGLLSSPVRKAAYSSLLESEKITREKGKFTPSLSVFDFDLDGEGEFIFIDDKVNCCIKARGAGIVELDYLPVAWNYLDTMTVNKDERRRCAFVDWLAPFDALPEHAGVEGIIGGRFCGAEEYEASDVDRLRKRARFHLPSKEGIPWAEIEIEKTWQLRKNSIVLDYVLRNTRKDTANFTFCPQIDLSFPGKGESCLRIFSIKGDEKEAVIFDDCHTILDAKIIEFQDIKNEALITMESSRNFNSRIFHIQREPGGYQSTCLMPFFPVNLEGAKNYRLGFTVKISS